MKDITHYFSDLSNNKSISLNKGKKKDVKMDEINIVLNENLNIKKNRDKVKMKISQKTNINTIHNMIEKSNSQHTTVNYKNTEEKTLPFTAQSNIDNINRNVYQLNVHQTNCIGINTKIKKIIKLDNEGSLKRKMIEEVTKSENNMNKRKKISIIKPNLYLEAIKNERFDTKYHDFTNLKHPDNLFKYFSKSIPENIENDQYMKTKVKIKTDIQESQISSCSVCSIFDNNDTSKLKKIQDKLDKIDFIKTKTSVIDHKKQKWSLKIQLQSTNIDVSDIMDVYAPLKTLQIDNENINISDEIPKILLPIKNKNKIHSAYESKSITNNNGTDKGLKIDSLDKLKNEEMKTQFKNFKNSICKENNANKSVMKNSKLCSSKMAINSMLTSQNLNLQLNMYKNNYVIIPSEVLILPFPKVSHISQLSLINNTETFTNNSLIKRNSDFKHSSKLLQIKNILKLDELYIPECGYKCIKLDIQSVLSEIESYCFNVQFKQTLLTKLLKFKCFNNTLKIKHIFSKKISKELGESNLQNELCNSLWIDKYKPNSSIDVVGNEESTAKLKSWLNYWKLLKNNEDYSSSEEFYTSDFNAFHSKEKSKVAVLIGPHGCGKTASVYAIANELGYRVLEVNASSRRLGKKILKDFEEATKSHRVETLNFKNNFTITAKAEKNINIFQNSLILMEDVDLVFDEDEGFVSAMCQLASNTKRPIIMTLSSNCSFLYKMAPQHFRIEYKSVRGKKVLAFLELIILAETGLKLSQNYLNVLCQSGDLRKELHQLQYLLLSNKKYIIPFTSLALNNSALKDLQVYIYKLAMKTSKCKKQKQIFNNISLSIFTLDNLVNYLDSFTLISLLANIDDPTSHLLDFKTEANISLLENARYYSSLDIISFDICNWFNDILKKLIFNDLKKIQSEISKCNHGLYMKKQIKRNISLVLSKIVPVTSDQQSLAVDYFSSIRTICRAEEIRNQVNYKRGNRFYHYLQNSKIKIEKSDKTLSTACEILQNRSILMKTSKCAHTVR